MPIRMMKLIGVETLIVTNAAGGLNQDYKGGDVMVIKDHINMTGMTGHHPLVGPNDDKLVISLNIKFYISKGLVHGSLL